MYWLITIYVYLRIYGEAHRKHRETLLIDSVVSTLLSERKLGPYVYGIFPDGRLEEFIEVRVKNWSGEIHQL
jgi:choline/ethanolamine kinase